MASESLFSTREAAEVLGVSLRTVQRWVETGRLRPAKRFGKGAVFTGDELRRAQQREHDGRTVPGRRRTKYEQREALFPRPSQEAS